MRNSLTPNKVWFEFWLYITCNIKTTNTCNYSTSKGEVLLVLTVMNLILMWPKAITLVGRKNSQVLSPQVLYAGQNDFIIL